jgi:predicted 2-oxoglutarate/Fe(II)-dependent dioxygenase YbiX
MKQIYDYIEVQNVLDKDLCNNIILSLNKKEWSSHMWSDSSGKQLGPRDKEELEVISPREEGTLLEKSVIDCCMKYKEKHVGDFSWIKCCSPIRFNKYVAGTNMEIHVDHIHSIFDGKHKGIPIISVVGLLNNNYKGGEFIFNDEYKVELKQGDILLFPSNFLYAHKVNNISEGTRYSFVTWGF